MKEAWSFWEKATRLRRGFNLRWSYGSTRRRAKHRR